MYSTWCCCPRRYPLHSLHADVTPVNNTATVCTAAGAVAAAVLLPGRKVANLTAGIDSSGDGSLSAQQIVAPGDTTELCPIGFYYDGQETVYSCKRCPLGSMTKQNGSESVDDW
jgi:putative intracellular protease/amidase